MWKTIQMCHTDAQWKTNPKFDMSKNHQFMRMVTCHHKKCLLKYQAAFFNRSLEHVKYWVIFFIEG